MEQRPSIPVLTYSISPRRSFARWLVRGTLALALVAALKILLTTVVHTDAYWMDPRTRALKHQTTWLGHALSPDVTETALDARLNAMGHGQPHTWQFYTETESTVLGNVRRGCSPMPQIGQCPPDLLDQFAREASDAEIRQFVGTMASGTDAQQHAALEAVFDRLLQSR